MINYILIYKKNFRPCPQRPTLLKFSALQDELENIRHSDIHAFQKINQMKQ